MGSLRSLVRPLLLALMVGCAQHKMITVETTPPDARLFLNGQDIGNAPLARDLEFQDGKTYEIVAKLPAYEDAKATIAYEPANKTDYPLALAKKERVVTRYVQIAPTPTNEGMELKPVEKQAIAYLETI